VKGVPRWRVAAGIGILAGFVFLLGMFSPYYFRNLQLQNFVSDLTRRAEIQTKPDDVVRTWVLDKAHELGVPVTEDNVHILHSPDSVRIDVRYVVRVNLPGYTVDLHFYPGAGSR
jgi:hypothetical protein